MHAISCITLDDARYFVHSQIMTSRDKTIAKVLTAKPETIRFSEFTTALTSLGFIHSRAAGSHQIWVHTQQGITLNIQPGKDGKSKPYQIKQFRSLWK